MTMTVMTPVRKEVKRVQRVQRVCRATYKVLDDAVEARALVGEALLLASAQAAEVLGGQGDDIGVQLVQHRKKHTTTKSNEQAKRTKGIVVVALLRRAAASPRIPCGQASSSLRTGETTAVEM